MLLDLEDLQKYGLSDEELIAYLTWDSDLPIKNIQNTDTPNEN